MNRRSFFQTALTTLGVLGMAKVFKMETAFAAPKKAAAKGGAKGVQATEESLKGLPKASGVTDANFWKQGDKIATVQSYCDASIDKNKACGDKRQPGQFCGSCTFLQERANYEGNVVGKCQLIPPQPPKTHVRGNNYCQSYVANAANKYEIKA